MNETDNSMDPKAEGSSSPKFAVIQGSRPKRARPLTGVEQFDRLLNQMLSPDQATSEQGFRDFNAFAERIRNYGSLSRVK